MISERRMRMREEKLDALGPPPSRWRVFARREWKRRRSDILAMDVTTYGEMLASLYDERFVKSLAYQQHPALSMIRKAPK